jgi:predicted nucleic acid-binding protein
MIIADTNVWVSFFKGEKKAAFLKDIIIKNQILLHPYIYGELLLGGIPQKAGQLLQSLESATVPKEHLVYYFITKNKMHSRGIGWVDVNILISALSEKHRVLTYDKNFEAICQEFDCHVN